MEILHNLFFSHPFTVLSGARRWSKLRWVWVSMSRATSNDTTVPMVVMSKPLAATSVAISKFLPRASRGYERCLWHQRKVKVWNGVKMCEVGWSSNYPSSPIFVGYTNNYEYTKFPKRVSIHCENSVLPPGATPEASNSWFPECPARSGMIQICMMIIDSWTL